MINQWLRSEQRTKEIANEKLQAELSFLKAQINPHFLFNTLNNIYALASTQSELTAPAVMKLSNIMRYVLTEARNDTVPLEKEIQFTTNYIELPEDAVDRQVQYRVFDKGRSYRAEYRSADTAALRGKMPSNMASVPGNGHRSGFYWK